jgi:hypothetical protein
MTKRVAARVAVGTDRVAENLRGPLVVPTHVVSLRPTRRTAHCHAATALLTRVYQGDLRRYRLTPDRDPRCHSLDNLFHIRGPGHFLVFRRPSERKWQNQ